MTTRISSAAPAIRTLAFVRKELVGVIRQPVLVVTLVVGPFLILLLFGTGLRDAAPEVETVFVAPPDSEVAEQARQFSQRGDTRLVIEGVTADLEGALDRLRRGAVDLVVEFPQDVDSQLSENRRPAIVFYHDFLDPIEAEAMVASMRTAVDEINQQVAESLVRQAQEDAGAVEDRIATANARVQAVRRALERGDEEEAQQQLALLQGQVAGLPDLDAEFGDPDESAQETVGELADQVDDLAASGDVPEEVATPLNELAEDLARLETRLDEFGRLPPGLFVSPFRGVAEHVVEGAVGLTAYYTPAVLVLLAQHLAVTFLGLSVVRDEELGASELFRVAPLTAGQVLAGKCIAYLLLTGVLTALLTALVVVGLDVPMRGSWWLLAVAVALVLLASTGLGFALALLARSATQAVQFAMMLLVANVFFTGFLVSLERLQSPVSAVPWLLPATYGVAMVRDVMLRGDPPSWRLLAILTAIAAGLLAGSWLLLRRRLLRA